MASPVCARAVLAGCLFFAEPRRPIVETVGVALLLVLGSTLLPAAYAALLGALGGATLLGGVLLGSAQGVLTAAILPGLGTITACIRAGIIPGPGPFGVRWGRFTPVALLLGHATYGAICGALLAGS